MKLGTGTKLIIGAVGVLIAGFVGFQAVTHRGIDQSATVAKGAQAKGQARRITAPRFVKRASGTVKKMPEEEPDTEALKAEETTIPEEVPTAQSSDDEIRDFLAWLSSLDAGNTSEETEMYDSEAEGNEIDYEKEKSLVNSVIWDKWKRGYESCDVELYMSAIWEDDYFYTSDTGTPDDPSDDIIFRGGQQERESAARVFSQYADNIELNLFPRSDVEFLSDTIAMAEYDYELKISQMAAESKFEAFYAPGNMVIILERREDSEGMSEWRILEWYDYATPK